MRRLLKLCSSKTITILSALAFGLSGPAVFAQASTGAPNTADSQVAYTLTGGVTSFNGPRGVAVAPDGTIYVADVTNGHVVRITTTNGGIVTGTAGGASHISGTGTALAPSISSTGPTAVAVDSGGVLYIADAGKHEVLKMTAPETSNTATAIAYGTSSRVPVALAVDPTTRDLYIADNTSGAYGIYKVAFVGGAITKLTLSATSLKPIGLAVDSASNLYFADATNNEIFKRTGAGSNSVYTNSVYLSIATSNTFTFKFSSATAPIGMNFDALGNMYVLDNGSTADHLFEIAPTTPTPLWYLVPISKLGSSTLASISIALDSIGNILLTDDSNNTLDYIYYNNPVNFGSVNAGTATPQVVANFQFNTTATTGLKAFQAVQGDYTGEFAVGTTACLPTGTTGTAGQTCANKYDATYESATPGFRAGSVGYTYTSTTNPVLAVQANATDIAGALAIYPGSQSTLTQSLYEPQGLAMSGDGTNLFIADEGGDFTQNPVTYTHGAVYQYPISNAGTIGSPTTITGTTTPMAVALDATGDLYAADYNGNIYVSQPTENGTTHLLSWGAMKPLTLTGVTLVHPMTITVDPSGDLFIGDMGSAGIYADSSTPGFVVEVPGGPLACGTSSCTIGGLTPFKLTNTTGVIFPDSVVTDGSGNLFIADGGDGDTNLGGVDVIPAPVATGTLAALNFGSVDQPSSLNIDAANNLYVLDAYNGRLLVAHLTQTGSTFAINGSVEPIGVNQSGNGTSGLTSALTTPSAAVVWPGASNITIADIGGGGQPVQVLTLEAFGAPSVNVSNSSSASLNVVNTGNITATFTAPTNTGPYKCTGYYIGGVCYGGTLTYSYSLTGGCGGASGNTLAVGVANACAATLSYNSAGGGAGSGTITLNGNTGNTYSALGNTIAFAGTGTGAGATLTAPVTTYTASVTATLKNTGGTTLTITSKTVTNATITGGTCGTTLTSGTSCTIIYNITATFTTAKLSVVDGAGTQTASTFYLPGNSFPQAMMDLLKEIF